MRRVVIIIVFLFLIVSSVVAFRIPRPPVLSLPLDINQINQLNDYIDSLWYLQRGEFNFDVVTETKSKAGAGDFWFIQTGNIIRIQSRYKGHIFTFSPDGY